MIFRRKRWGRGASWVLAASFGVLACSSTTPDKPSVAASEADTASARGSGIVSFTFDDCYLGQLTQAAPILAARGFKATEYAAILRLTEQPDIGNAPFMTWKGLHTLHDQFGWDIASHTMTHPLLTTVAPDQLDEELVQSKATLEANGFHITGFATPYGDYNDNVLRRSATLYDYHRPFHDIDVMNQLPIDRSLLWVKQVQVGGGPDNIPSVSVAQVQTWIDQAIQQRAWLILIFHDVEDRPAQELSSQNVAWGYGYNSADFAQIADYCVTSGVSVRTPEQVLATVTGPNMVPNGGFASGLLGFTTDQPQRVTLDTRGNGASPTPQDSIALAGGSQGAHLFGPHVPVVSGASYTIETYVNAYQLTGGSIGFYVDEWDKNGNWVSGQYVRDVPEDPRRRVEHVAFDYVPGSAASSASLQVILSPGAAGVAYVDEVSWRAGRNVY